jgi:hypothetical protein
MKVELILSIQQGLLEASGRLSAGVVRLADILNLVDFILIIPSLILSLKILTNNIT